MKERLVRFDWAMKKLLRNKANFEILEGFLSELLKQDVRIEKILESESNKESRHDKYNRVDLLTEIESGELVEIILRLEYRSDYFDRLTNMKAKTVSENIMPEPINCKINRLICLNILYFDAACGEDYIYYGMNDLIGIHKLDLLELSDKQDKMFKIGCQQNNIIPEYFILKIHNFDDTINNKLDEWIYYLKNTAINSEFSAQGILKALHVLKLTNLAQEEREAFDRFIDNWRVRESTFYTAWLEGKMQGEREIAMKWNIETAIEMIKDGESNDKIRKYTELTDEEIERLRMGK